MRGGRGRQGRRARCLASCAALTEGGGPPDAAVSVDLVRVSGELQVPLEEEEEDAAHLARLQHHFAAGDAHLRGRKGGEGV